MVRKLLLLLVWLTARSSSGQTFTVLRAFGSLDEQTGVQSEGRLAVGPDGFLYGTTSDGVGGGVLHGTVFKFATNGLRPVVLKQFTNVLEGWRPRGGLIVASNSLYGVTTAGGEKGGGGIFRLDLDGRNFAVLKWLPEGAYAGDWPVGALTCVGSTLYGSTRNGGSASKGTLFRLNLDGSDYRVLKEFSGRDGASPNGELLTVGDTLFGTTTEGGADDLGTIYKIRTNGDGFSILRSFSRAPAIDGNHPVGGLIADGEALYGVCWQAAAAQNGGSGTVFGIRTDGSDYRLVATFGPRGGTKPIGPLILADGTLYGTASDFGNNLDVRPGPFAVRTNGEALRFPGAFNTRSRSALVLNGANLYGITWERPGSCWPLEFGAIFQIHTNGSTQILYTFPGFSTAESRPTSLVRVKNRLYGTSIGGGAGNSGLLFGMEADGSDFKALKDFREANGAPPIGSLAVFNDTLFGATEAFVYRIEVDGSGFQILHRFGEKSGDGLRALSGPIVTNGVVYGTTRGRVLYAIEPDGENYHAVAEGSVPDALTVLDGELYGASYFDGALYSISAGGEAEVLHTFTEMSPPVGPLTVVGNRLIGAGFPKISSPEQVAFAEGRIFSVNRDGSDFRIMTVLSNRLAGDVSVCGLVVAGDSLYGVTGGQPDQLRDDQLCFSQVGSWFTQLKRAAIFRLKADGSDPVLLYELDPSVEGILLEGNLVVDGNTIYGVARAGGANGEGTVFRLDLQPRLNCAVDNARTRLSWPAYARDAVLEFKDTLGTGGWTPVNCTVTADQTKAATDLPASATTAFYRLHWN